MYKARFVSGGCPFHGGGRVVSLCVPGTCVVVLRGFVEHGYVFHYLAIAAQRPSADYSIHPPEKNYCKGRED